MGSSPSTLMRLPAISLGYLAAHSASPSLWACWPRCPDSDSLNCNMNTQLLPDFSPSLPSFLPVSLPPLCFNLESHYFAQVGLKLLGSSNFPTLASQISAITGTCQASFAFQLHKQAACSPGSHWAPHCCLGYVALAIFPYLVSST